MRRRPDWILNKEFLTEHDMIRLLADEHDFLTLRKAKVTLRAFENAITKGLSNLEKVHVKDFGVFSSYKRAAAHVFQPDGKAHYRPECIAVRFKAYPRINRSLDSGELKHDGPTPRQRARAIFERSKKR